MITKVFAAFGAVQFSTWIGAVPGLVAVVTTLYTLYKNMWEPAKVSIAPGALMAIVVHQEPPRRFHIRGALVNDAAKAGTLQHLEAEVKAPGGTVQRYVWNERFEFVPGSLRVQGLGRPIPIPVPGRSSTTLLVQLELVGSNMVSDWAVGRHEFKLLGWVNRKTREPGPNVACVFHITVPTPVVSDPAQPWAFREYAVEEWSS